MEFSIAKFSTLTYWICDKETILLCDSSSNIPTFKAGLAQITFSKTGEEMANQDIRVQYLI